MLLLIWLLPNSFSFLTSDLGGLHQLPQRSVSGFSCNISKTHLFLSRLLDVDVVVHSFSEAVGSYAENQRITAVRRVYQRGCVNPMINIEQLWRDYSKYEEVSDPPVRVCT